MAIYGLAKTPFQKFCDAYDACLKAWGSDPAYRDYAFQIQQAMRGISLLEASPGMRAAMNLPSPSATGQAAPAPGMPSGETGVAVDS